MAVFLPSLDALEKEIYMKKLLNLILAALMVMFLGISESQASSKVYSLASNYKGLHERSNTRQLQSLMGVNPKKTPWCAAFINAILRKKGLKTTGSNMAISFRHYGVKTTKPKVGDIVVLSRKGGNHVGFFAGFVTKGGVKYVAVLGGNQSNSVGIKHYKVRNVVAYRSIK
jgi:uncharacterized protein (TIGR02594 family)